jgi:3-methylcrotonyl-CoA carboxylase alpha subunit
LIRSNNHNVRIKDETISVNDADFEIERVDEGIYLVDDGKRRWRVAVAGPPDDRWVFVEGQVERVEIVSPTSTWSRSRSGPTDMSAPMPATVVKVLVEPGASVVKGDPVLMLEAMKMELAVRAARTGIVRAVHCEPGELVQPGVPLLEIEE